MGNLLFTNPAIDKTELKEVIKEAISELAEEDHKESRTREMFLKTMKEKFKVE